MERMRTQSTESVTDGLTGLRDHPLRAAVSAEVHARPFEPLAAPLRATHLALVTDSEANGSEHAHVAQLCREYGVTPPAADAIYFSADFGPFRMRWERHTEFSSYTFFRPGLGDAPFAETAMEEVPRAWLNGLPGQLLAAIHLVLEGRDVPVHEVHEVVELFGTDNVAGSWVSHGDAVAWTDFRTHDDGFGRILVQDRNLGQRQAGRLVQRLFEIETYRLMALLAFPLARRISPDIARLDTALQNMAQKMTDSTRLEDEQALLEELSQLAFEVERCNAQTSYRLSASRAYYALVSRRIESLREERLHDVQTIGKFMERRLAPAMSTCESVGERQETLARRVARASNLLRTRVDVALEQQNRDLLESMNGRAKMQLRLQQTVEGLSVVVLSYYTMGLLAYAAKAVKSAGVPVPVEIGLGVAVPLVVFGVWAGTRYMRRRLFGDDHGSL